MEAQAFPLENGISQLLDLQLNIAVSLSLWDFFSFLVTGLLVPWFQTGHQGLDEDKSALGKIIEDQATVLGQPWGKGEEDAITGCVPGHRSKMTLLACPPQAGYRHRGGILRRLCHH